MEAFELPAMLMAMALSLAVIVAKVMITQLIGRMNRQIGQVAQVKNEALGRLKAAQGQKAVIAKNHIILDKKKTKLAKKIGRQRNGRDQRRGSRPPQAQRGSTRQLILF